MPPMKKGGDIIVFESIYYDYSLLSQQYYYFS